MSEQPKWTPGPWEVRPSDEYYGHYIITKIDGRNVEPEEDEANACLIGLAPELYAALGGTLRALLEYEFIPVAVHNRAREHAEAVLAKARGEKHDGN